MLNYDVQKATQKLMMECRESERLARMTAEGLAKLHPDLHPIVEAWMNGETPEFEYEGMNLAYIRNKMRNSYIDAVIMMSVLLENPDLVETFKKRKSFFA